MKVWTNTEFEGHYPVGVSAVVVANAPEEAEVLLNDELEAHGLSRSAKASQFVRVITAKAHAVVLQNGDY